MDASSPFSPERGRAADRRQGKRTATSHLHLNEEGPMFRSKKSVRSLTVALSLIVVLAMLAPAAIGSPGMGAWSHD